MKTLAKNGSRHEAIKIISKEGSLMHVSIGDREYTLDIEKVEEGVYSVLHNGTSHNMEIIKSAKKDSYTVNTRIQTFDIEISNAGPLEKDSKKRVNKTEEIIAPIPGKVISVKVSPGDPVKEGQTLIILSAMKMENELKSPIDGIISRVSSKEDDIVKDGEVLIDVKPATT